ncbi:MAG TPA: T9SS type A sorting domain-containing protein [Rhodothermales bacterium]
MWPERATQTPVIETARRFGQALTCGVYISAPRQKDGAPGFVSGMAWGGQWVRHTVLSDSNPGAQRPFGSRLAEADDRLVVSLAGFEDGSAGNEERVFVLARGPGLRYVSFDTLSLPEAVPVGYGASIATSGGAVAVGAPLDDSNGDDAGAVYVFTDASTLSRSRDVLPARQLRVFPHYPNPVHGDTIIRFALAQPADVRLCVYDALGRIVEEVEIGFLPAGQHTIPLSLAELSSGVYFYVVASGLEHAIGRLVRVR